MRDPFPHAAIPRACGLAAAIGRDEYCPGDPCLFWEVDGSREPSGRCGMEEVAPYLPTLPELAEYLLELRSTLRVVVDPCRDS